ncbi:MAG TPA: serine/threonine-protein kinase [Actinoplanes sp.]|nr:serine/threonine-protein kinase [Actinoplanes sp.]
MAQLPMGTAILRRYVLVGVIGQGGVSTVYSAVDASHGRILAVKVLAPTLADDPHARDDVRREALITDRLRHPCVPRVYEYGDAPLPDGTVVPYVVLELLSGVPLTHRLAAGPLPWRDAVRIAATAADVLAVAHRRGIVHRDLCARNIMVTADGIKIIDFGLATAAIRNGDTGARPIVLRGGARRPGLPRHPKTSFASPADDVYTLGVLLYEMVTGRSPYPARTAATILAAGRVAHLAPTPVLAVAGLPDQVGEIVRACMAKVPEARPRSADAALALWEVLDRDERRVPAAVHG